MTGRQACAAHLACMCLQAREVTLEHTQRHELSVSASTLQQLPRITEAAVLLAGAGQGNHASIQLAAAGRGPAQRGGPEGQD